MVRKVRLYKFRNYNDRTVALEPGINLIIGDNGVGKTNLLEAVFLLIEGKSIRTSDLREAVKEGEEEAVIEGWLGREVETKKKVVIRKEGETKREKAGEMAAVFFTPDDIDLVKGSPELRRRYIDEAIKSVKPDYKETVREYARVLKQRNEAIKMVRRGAWGREYIHSWDPLLLEKGADIVEERRSMIRKIEERMNVYGRYWDIREIRLKYYTNLSIGGDTKKINKEKLEKTESAEIRRGMTLIGPHRDEIVFYLNGRSLKREGSQGEQKIAALLWRLSQAGVLKEEKRRTTLLLLDDCFSELDQKNRRSLAQAIKDWEQVLVTATDDLKEMGEANKQHIKVDDNPVPG